jgi:creatinine amidohydrolase
MKLHLRTWPEVESYLTRSNLILIPIGSTEQHGPTGLIGTDAICAEAIADKAAETLGAMVGPTLGIGMAHHHMAFPGSLTLRPSTLVALVHDLVVALARQGFHRVILVNGHGGNIASVQAGFYEAYMAIEAASGANRPDIRCLLVNWWETPRTDTLSRSMFGDALGAHATPAEVAVTQAVHPHGPTPPLEPRVAPMAGFFDCHDFRRRFPDGRMGSDPSLATPELGQALLSASASDLVDICQAFVVD